MIWRAFAVNSFPHREFSSGRMPNERTFTLKQTSNFTTIPGMHVCVYSQIYVQFTFQISLFSLFETSAVCQIIWQR